MSFNLNLEEILKDLKDTTNQIDTTVNNISNSANRLVLEMNKNTDQIHADSKNHELMLKSTQEIMNIFTNFKLTSDNKVKNKSGDSMVAADKIKAATTAAGIDNKDNNQNDFEQYKAMVENRTNQIDREVDRLNALRDVVKEILN